MIVPQVETSHSPIRDGSLIRIVIKHPSIDLDVLPLHIVFNVLVSGAIRLSLTRFSLRCFTRPGMLAALACLLSPILVWSGPVTAQDFETLVEDGGCPGCDLVLGSYREMNIADADFQGTVFREADLKDSILEGADFSGSDLRRASLEKGNFRGANFTSSQMRGADLEKSSLAGAIFVNADLRDADFGESDLSKANFSGADMRDAFLRRATLNGASFKGVKLLKADLERAILEQADFTDANMEETDFSRVNGKGSIHANAVLTFSNLSHSDFTEADFSGANLEGSLLRGTNFSGANLGSALGLLPEQLALACGDEKTMLPEGLEILNCSMAGQ